MKGYIVTLTFLYISLTLNAQDKIVNVTALPIGYFSPETSLALGGLVNTNFYLQDKSYRPSSILLGGAYTLRNQLLLYLPFELNMDKNQYLVKGELGYYRYFYRYYGLGASFRNDFETYTVNFPRVRMTASYRFYGNHYAGIKYNFDDYRIQELDPEGELLNAEVPGFQSSLVSLLGLVHTYDSRDYIFSSTKGWFITSTLEYNGGVLGSNFEFVRIVTDVIKYITIKDEQILALNIYGGTTYGTPPFQEYLLYGGGNKARGYFQGHYRDKALILAQAEYRFQIWKRFGATVFGSLGNVGPSLNKVELSTSKWNAGIGLRFLINKKDRLNARLDYAIGRETSGLYITIGEAF